MSKGPVDMLAQLTKPAPQSKLSKSGPVMPAAPLGEMAVQVTLDQVRPYDRNPRTQQNPQYTEIKDSIRCVGLKHPPAITQRPGDEKYMISDGGNTRLKILRELYEETGEDRFYRFWCVFHPWKDEVAILAGHLSENENRGDLSWIEKALGTVELKRMIETKENQPLSQRELSRRFRELGFSIDHSHISRMFYTVEHLWPTFPLTLKNGLGKDQIKKLIRYREACLAIWKRVQADPEDAFAPAWHATMNPLDFEEQSALPWSIIEDRSLGLLEDATGIHLHTLDYTLKGLLKYGHRQDVSDKNIWEALDKELHRDDDVRMPVAPPIEDSESKILDFGTDKKVPYPKAEPLPMQRAVSVETHEHEATNIANALRPSDIREEPHHSVEPETIAPADHSVIPSCPATAEGQEIDDFNFIDTRSEEEKTAALTLSSYEESEPLRRAREAIGKIHGEETGRFSDFAPKAIPLMSAGPIVPITDIWYADAFDKEPDRLRQVIFMLASTIGQWAGFPLQHPDDEAIPIWPTNDGIGFELIPLTAELEKNPTTSGIWQLLAALSGYAHPLYPSDITMLGSLLGTAESDTGMPDEILIRFFRLIRLIRVLRTQDDRSM